MECKEAHQTSNGFAPKIDGNEQVSTDSDKIMGYERRVSPRLKCIYDSKRPHYGTSQIVSAQCLGDNKKQVHANMNHFIQKTPPAMTTEEKSDEVATQNIASNVFEPQNGSNLQIFMNSEQSMSNQESVVQRRVSPRLKNISESKRPYYGVAQRNLPKPTRDQKNQETGNANNLMSKSSLIIRRKRDRNNRCTSELEHLEQNGLPKRTSGEVKNQCYRSDLTDLNGASCSVVRANGFIDSKVADPKWLDDGNIAPNADGKSSKPMVKETLRVYYVHYRHFVQVHFTRSHGLKALSKLPGLVSKDISGGQEDISIPVINSIDDTLVPTDFIYSKSVQVVDDIKLPPNAEGCDCKGNCTNPKVCACARLNGTDFPYVREKGVRLIEAKDIVFECGPNCCCGPNCINRTSQRGIKFKLEVFRSSEKGWAVRSGDFIPSGAPVCEYTGVLRRTDELDNVAENDYIFEIDCLHTMKEIGGRVKRLGDALVPFTDQLEKIDDKSVDSTPEFCIDAGSVGNVARFINHSCDPNLFVQCVLSTHHDARLARLVLFAADNIAPFQELTYDYGYALDSVVGPDGKVKQQPCHCGTSDCRKRLY